MTETRSLSRFASIANAAFNSMTANSTAVTSMTVGGVALNANGVASNTYTIGTAAYFVANGNLGIGTTSPGSALDVNGNIAVTGAARRITSDMSSANTLVRFALQSSTTNGDTGVYVLPNGTATTSGFLLFANSNPSNTSAAIVATTSTEFLISSSRSGTGTFLPMTFSAGGSERMRIAANGNVGVGLAAPVARLQTTGAAATASPTGGSANGSGFYINNTDTAYGMQFGISGTGHGWIQQQRSDGTNDQYNLILQPIGGNVGIGTISPGLGLTVERNNGNGWAAWFGANTSSDRVGLGVRNSRASIQGFNSSGNGADLVLQPDSGNVGIGTTAPNTRLTVVGVASSLEFFHNVPSIRFASSPNRTNSWYMGANISDTVNGGIHIGSGADIGTGTLRMIIDSSGNVGIGTSSPGGRLDVSSAGQNIIISRSTGGYAAFQRFAPAGQQVYDFYTVNNTEVARITADASNFLAFSTGSSATERMRIDALGRVTMPSQPAFTAVGSGSISVSISNYVLILNTAPTNRGSHFNTSTYRFTAPVAGMYLFAFRVTWGSTGSGVSVSLAVNGTSFGGASGYTEVFGYTTGTSYHTTSASITAVQLNANDYVDLRTNIYNSSAQTIDVSRVSLTGYLIG